MDSYESADSIGENEGTISMFSKSIRCYVEVEQRNLCCFAHGVCYSRGIRKIRASPIKRLLLGMALTHSSFLSAGRGRARTALFLSEVPPSGQPVSKSFHACANSLTWS
jgi:hypothetical protein